MTKHVRPSVSFEPPRDPSAPSPAGAGPSEPHREDQRWLDAMFQQAAVGIAVAGLDGRFLEVNPRFAEILGYRPGDMLGMSVADLTHPDDLEQTNAHMRRIATGESDSYVFEKRYLRRDGAEIWSRTTVTLIRDERGRAHRYLGVIQDITARKHAENELRESERRLSTLMANLPGAAYRAASDPRRPLAFASSGVLELTGYTPEDFAAGRVLWMDLVHPEDAEALRRELRRAERERTRFSHTYRIVHAAGLVRWVLDRGQPLYDGAGAPAGCEGFVSDLTDLKRAERALAESARQQESLYGFTDRLQRADSLEEIYDAALDSIVAALGCSRASVLLFDDAGSMQFVGWRGLSEGYRRAVSGHSPWGPEDRDAAPICVGDIERADFPEPLRAVIRGEGIRALGFVPLIAGDRLIGKFMVYYDRPHAFTPAETDLALTIARQLAFAIERKRADVLLRARARQQQMVAQIGEHALRERDPQGVLDYAVRAIADTLEVECCKVLELLPGGAELLLRSGVGWKPGLVGRATVGSGGASQAGYTLGSDTPVVVADFRHEARFSPPPLLVEHGVVSGMSCVIRAEDRTLYGVLGVHSTRPKRFTGDDVSFLVAVANIMGNAIRRDAAERALRRSEGLLRAVVETAVDGIVTIDERGVIRTVNPAVERIFGYPAEELVGRNVSVLMPEPYHAEHDAYLARYLATGQRKIIGIGREVRGKRRDGSVFPLELGVSETTVGRQRIFTGIIRDITERKRTEEELRLHREQLERLVAARTAELEESHRRLRLSERMASLGTLSAGLGHDMGNILVPMRVWIDLLSQRVGDPEAGQHLRSLHQSTEYLKALAAGLRSLSLDPDDESAAPQQTSLAAWWPEVHALYRASLPRAVTLHEPRVECLPPVRIPAHALTQAVFNLVQNAGDLMRDAPEPGNIWLDAERLDEDCVTLTVRDDGPGMTHEVRQRCMEPFFTTKARERGTGLGLSIVYNIMRRYGGSVELESEPGRGAAFALKLPIASEGLDPRRIAAVTIADPRGAAIARMLLAGAGFAPGSAPAYPGVSLWIVDGSVPGEDIRRFLARHAGRRVLRIGPGGDPEPRLECVPELKPSLLRAALERAGRALSGHAP